MKRLLLLALVAAATVAAREAPAASAPSVRICGMNGCAGVLHRRAELEVWSSFQRRNQRFANRSRPALQAYYRLRWTNPRTRKVVEAVFAPRARALRWNAASARWIPLNQFAIEALGETVRTERILPFPKPASW